MDKNVIITKIGAKLNISLKLFPFAKLWIIPKSPKAKVKRNTIVIANTKIGFVFLIFLFSL